MAWSGEGGGHHGAKGHESFRALVDASASKTIVSARVAKRVGIRRLSTGHLSRAGELLEFDVGLAFAHAEGCHPEVLLAERLVGMGLW